MLISKPDLTEATFSPLEKEHISSQKTEKRIPFSQSLVITWAWQPRNPVLQRSEGLSLATVKK